MIIFGGSIHDNEPVEGGASYDPGSDTWTPIATLNAPTRRASPAAVWTGTELVVWGGSYRQDGAKYDPERDVWTPMSSEGAPIGRIEQTFVWTGTEMLVWGGIRAGNFARSDLLADGAAYNPKTNTWSPIEPKGAPSARQEHATAWTGKAMIVWGGTNTAGFDGDCFNDGAMYDPAARAWTAITGKGAPEGRAKSTGVWTGSQFLVVGGNTMHSGVLTARFYQDAYVYDPRAEAWHAIELEGVPHDSASSVWTGTELFYWDENQAYAFRP
jgi:N-acetylneuraminic acid mutarotase